MLGKVDTVMRTVREMERSVRFYRDALGFDPEMVSPHGSIFRGHGGSRLALHIHDPEHGPFPEPGRATASLGWHVADIRAGVAALQERDVTFGAGPQEQDWGWIAHFEDPDGHIHWIAQPKDAGC